MTCLAMIAKEDINKTVRAIRSAQCDDHVVVIAPGDPLSALSALESPKVCVLERPWEDYSTARNYALHAAWDHQPFALVLDADDFLMGDIPPLDPAVDAYEIKVQYLNTGCYFWRKHILRTDRWEYRGKVHEVATFMGVGKPRVERLHDVVYFVPGVSDRAGKYKEYIRLLEGDPSPRAAFYRAYAYRDNKQWDKALSEFRRRGRMTEGWVEERYMAFIHSARLAFYLGHPINEVKDDYQAASLLIPHRAEAFHGMAQVVGWQDIGLSLACAREAARIRPPSDGLFIEPHAYGDKALVESLLLGRTPLGR